MTAIFSYFTQAPTPSAPSGGNGPSASFGGRVVKQLEDAGKAFCNLISNLWDKVVSFVAANAPSKQELEQCAVVIKRGASDCLRGLSRFVSDFPNSPSFLTQGLRAFGDGMRGLGRDFSDWSCGF